jgi:hypothetical protein
MQFIHGSLGLFLACPDTPLLLAKAAVLRQAWIRMRRDNIDNIDNVEKMYNVFCRSFDMLSTQFHLPLHVTYTCRLNWNPFPLYTLVFGADGSAGMSFGRQRARRLLLTITLMSQHDDR